MRFNRVYLFGGLVILCIFLSFFAIAPLTTPPANKWALSLTQIDKLHQLGLGGSGVRIGIIDTGLDNTHHDFNQNSFIEWQDQVTNSSSFCDADGYGTHLSGLLVSEPSFTGLLSGIHMRGIAPDAQLIIAKVVPPNLYFYKGSSDANIASAVTFCLDSQADIILLSLGIAPEQINFQDLKMTSNSLLKATQKGVYVVVPAGNDGEDDDGDVCLPGRIPEIITVGSVSSTQTISPFSSRGHQYPSSNHPHKKPELVAPGDSILSTYPNGAYASLSGTSQAACYVAGIISLLLEAYPQYQTKNRSTANESTVLLFKQILAESAKKIDSLQDQTTLYSHDDRVGYGLIQAYEAYKMLGEYT